MHDYNLIDAANLEPVIRLPASVTGALASVVDYLRKLKHILDASPEQTS